MVKLLSMNKIAPPESSFRLPQSVNVECSIKPIAHLLISTPFGNPKVVMFVIFITMLSKSSMLRVFKLENVTFWIKSNEDVEACTIEDSEDSECEIDVFCRTRCFHLSNNVI
mmetsp:Transcript_42120/g.48877  ORF Transcript_42120/g.48877 Transcript_42120/m.48877 type:complete len:112 (-) Transcript_42120:555-890(-)